MGRKNAISLSSERGNVDDIGQKLEIPTNKETLMVNSTRSFDGVRLYVRQCDIRNCGAYTDNHNCVIATAAKRQFGLLPARINCSVFTIRLDGQVYEFSNKADDKARNVHSLKQRGLAATPFSLTLRKV